MRGKDLPKIYANDQERITPAYAGKSVGGDFGRGEWRDHPRVCGEKTKKIP